MRKLSWCETTMHARSGMMSDDWPLYMHAMSEGIFQCVFIENNMVIGGQKLCRVSAGGILSSTICIMRLQMMQWQACLGTGRFLYRPS